MFSLQKTALENLVYNYSKANDGRYLNPSTVEILSSGSIRQKDGCDTKTILQTKSGIKPSSTATLIYARKNIAELLPGELVLPLGQQRTTADVINQIAKRYQLKLFDTDVVVEKVSPTEGDIIKLRMRENHPIWKGEISVRIGAHPDSLASKLPNMVLTDDDPDSRIPAELLYFGLDFTSISKDILANGEGYVSKELKSSINSAVPHIWYHSKTSRQNNLQGATIVYLGEVSSSPIPVNADEFTAVCVIALSDLCTNYKGNLVLHFNI